MCMKLADIGTKQIVTEAGEILEVSSIEQVMARVDEMIDDLDDKRNQRIQEGPQKVS